MLPTKKSLSICLDKVDEPTIELFYSKKNNDCLGKNTLYKLISKYKGFIDNINNSKKWDYAKKISNEYELINQNGYKSISMISPISRSYFKLLELIIDFNLIDVENFKYRYAGIAEGPGGFIECFINYRKKFFLGRNDYIQCMTLKSFSQDVPNWNKAKKIFFTNRVNICYGVDGTGDLYNAENIIEFRKQFGGNTADFVTADGGFDYSIDFNRQEHASSKLIYAEILCALSVNKKGGHFVLKIFDIYTSITIKLLYLLNVYYNEIIITKPYTSRPANSEKYIVCKGFRGIKEETLKNYYSILQEWSSIEKNGYHVIDFKNIKIPKSYQENINIFNTYYAKSQIINILKTSLFINYEIQPKDLIYLKKKQTLYALEWCKKYKNGVNLNCVHLKM